MENGLREFWTHPATVLAGILLLDMIFGDPRVRWHPVVVLGRLIQMWDADLTHFKQRTRFGGVLLLLASLFFFLTPVIGFHFLFGLAHWSLALAWDLFIGWSVMALRSLLDHGRAIQKSVASGDLTEARRAALQLAGRDENQMDLMACGRVGVESLSENLVDGVLTPLFFYALLGVPGMAAFKIVSTLDSMVGYKNETYVSVGWASARLDDGANFIPARMSLPLIALGTWGLSFFHRGLSAKKAWQVSVAQHQVFPSPNSGWPEAAFAGALGVRLIGPIWRGGEKITDLWVGIEGDPEGGTARDLQVTGHLVLLTTALFAAGVFAWLIWLRPW